MKVIQNLKKRFAPTPGFRVLGLTGGVACGKSHVAEWLRDKGVAVLDLDALGKDILAKDVSLHQQMIDIFGSEIEKAGKLDRKKMRAIVFSDPSRRTSLEQVLHPKIIREAELQVSRLKSEGKSVVILEAALLFEHGYYQKLDGTILVTAPEERRLQWLQARDGISELLAKQMIDSQWTDEKKRPLASVVLENRGTLEDLKLATQKLAEELNLY